MNKRNLNENSIVKQKKNKKKQKNTFDLSKELIIITEFQKEIELDTFFFNCIKCNKEDIGFYSTGKIYLLCFFCSTKN